MTRADVLGNIETAFDELLALLLAGGDKTPPLAMEFGDERLTAEELRTRRDAVMEAVGKGMAAE